MRDARFSARVDRVHIPSSCGGVEVAVAENNGEHFPAIQLDAPGVHGRLDLSPADAAKLAEDLQAAAAEAVAKTAVTLQPVSE